MRNEQRLRLQMQNMHLPMRRLHARMHARSPAHEVHERLEADDYVARAQLQQVGELRHHQRHLLRRRASACAPAAATAAAAGAQ